MRYKKLLIINTFLLQSTILLCILLVGTSIEAQVTFNPTIEVSDTNQGHRNYPAIGIAHPGTLYSVWYDNRNGSYRIYFSKSTDSGDNWQENQCISDAIYSCYYPSIAVSPTTGAIFVVWDAASGIYFAKSTNGGESFENITVIGDGFFPAAIVDSEDNVYVAWESCSWPREIYFRKSTDGGCTFDSTVRVDDGLYDGAFYPCLAKNSKGHIFVSWRYYHQLGEWEHIDAIYCDRSTDGGENFGSDVCVDGCTNNPSIAVFDSQFVYISSHGSTHCDGIFLAKSTNGGLTFGSHVRVNDTTGGLQCYSSVAVDDSGNIHVAWLHSGFGSRIRYSRSTDGGISFSPSVVVHDTSVGGGRPCLKIDHEYNIHVVWVSYYPDRINYAKGSLMPGVAEDNSFAQNCKLLKIYPNPFPAAVNVQLSINKQAFVSLKVYDVTGSLVKILLDEERLTGKYTLIWDPKDLSNGIFFLKLQIGSYQEIQKLVLIR